MPLKKATFRILRYQPGRIDPPAFQNFTVQLEPAMSVLDGLEQIRLNQDEGLIYRHSCHHAACGTCACTINGTPALACTTRIDALEGDAITLAPLENYVCIGDLAVDRTDFFDAFDPDWATIRECENAPPQRSPEGVDALMRLENCIECGCCVSACPVVSSKKAFLGPALLAAVNNERRNRPDNAPALLRIAAQVNGAAQCDRHIACSRVCPSRVYPARHIADLQRAAATPPAQN